MGDSSPFVLEISSDEEVGFGDSRKGRFDVADGEDCEWLSKLLGEVGGNIDDDSDDVVLVSEVFPKAPKRSRSESLKPSAKVVDIVADDDDDDDCVVLDGDPDKTVVVVNNKVEDDDDSDDLEIVGEKGEVACRDFPHPRHLCAKFLFASTPHEVHCGQCHCYVCDSLAPCSRWGTGTSGVDHCHASDNEEYWRAERKHVKKADNLVQGVSTTTTYGTNRIGAFFPKTQVPPRTRPQSNYLTQSRGSNHAPIHPLPISSNVIVPNPVNQIRSHPSEYAVPRLVGHTHNNIIPSRNNSQHVGSRNPQPFPPRSIFKRHGLVGASLNNRHAYGPQLSRDPYLKRCRTLQAPILNGHYGSNQQNVGSRTAGSVTPQPRSSSPHSMNGRCPNYLPSHSQISSQPYSNLSNQDPVQYQSQTPVPPYVNRNLSSTVPLQPNIASRSSAESMNNLVLPQRHVFHPINHVPSQAVASYHSDAGNAFGNQLDSGPMISSHPDVGNNLENHSSPRHAHCNPTCLLVHGQNNVQQGNQTQNGIDVTPTDLRFFLGSSLNNGNLQIHAEESLYQSTAPAEISQLPNEPKNDQHPSIQPMDNFPPQSAVLANYTSPVNDSDCEFPQSTGPDPLDFQFDNWMLENPPLSEALEDCPSPNWHVFSPEPSFIDTGTLFDI